MNVRKLWLIAILALLAVVMVACGSDSADEAASGSVDTNSDEAVKASEELEGELVIYSSRKEEFVQPILDKFTEQTGVEVHLLATDETVVNRIVEEQVNPQADIFFSNDTAAMEYLHLEGILQPYEGEDAKVIDEKYRASDNSWIGLSARTRGFIYNKDLISEEEMPQTIEELADPKWDGQYAITRGGNGSMIAHVAALRAEWGDDKTAEWLQESGKNAGAVLSGHGDIRKAVGAGEFKFGLVNNYYYHQQLAEAEGNNVGFIYPDQGEDEMGAFVNAAGIGFINGAPNPENAEAFISFMLEEDNMKDFAFNSKEVPLHPDVEAVPEALPISEYKTMDIPLSELGPVWNDAKQLIEQSGLPLEVQ
ncbi:extracellular solute-binding protein [Jeotgalibacillus soli]|uniref:Iron transporter n=1 Tax=Jeotgalibacillus soli TaxID=889306 RepID=A0A0C2R2Z7_9BACL|nr:extracellular solute-binding protein [Jeotgalibacillus soli]KIL44635.1 iron transporter [Jeotgalibacillus soli]